MDPIELHSVKLECLKDQAGRADARILELNQELLLHRGGTQHLGQCMALIDGHRSRLLSKAKARKDGPDPVDERLEAEDKACLDGIVDALTYVRAQIKASEMSAHRAEAALQEMNRLRLDLSTQGKAQANKLDEMAEQIARGVPRELVGRPKTAQQVRENLDKIRGKMAENEAKAAEKTKRKAAAPG